MAEKESAPQRPPPQPSTCASPPALRVNEHELDELLARARQAVKPIINREAANEVVSDELLNFRMKVVRTEE
jgi:hypothetical protein